MTTRRWLLNTVTAAILVGLGACGGGGDDGPPPVTGPTINITAANRDNVAHAAAAGILALSPTGAMIPMSNAAGATGLVSALARPFGKWLGGAVVQRDQPQAVYGPYVYLCTVSGTVSETDDDRDENGIPSVGDVVTLVYSNCQEAAGETLNGSMTMTMTAINVSPVASGTADVTLSQMSAVTANHSMTINGAAVFHYALPTSTSLETARMTASGPMTVAVSTHVGYSDTLTLQSGFVGEETYDPTLMRTVSTCSGLLQSAAAGGVVDVRTVAGAPLTKYDADAYPSAGVVQVTGRNSTLQATALSASSVRLDLDADNNGSFETSNTVAWDWLL